MTRDHALVDRHPQGEDTRSVAEAESCQSGHTEGGATPSHPHPSDERAALVAIREIVDWIIDAQPTGTEMEARIATALAAEKARADEAERGLERARVELLGTDSDIAKLERELAAWKADAEAARIRANEAQHALWQYRSCGPGNVDLLRRVAEEWDCDPSNCDRAGSDMGALVCAREDRDGCRHIDAEALRDLAKAIEIRASMEGKEASNG